MGDHSGRDELRGSEAVDRPAGLLRHAVAILGNLKAHPTIVPRPDARGKQGHRAGKPRTTEHRDDRSLLGL